MAQPAPKFIVSKRQMGAMSNLIADEFVVQCREFQRENFPDLVPLPDAELDQRTREMIALGARHGFQNEFSIQRLIAFKEDYGFTLEDELPAPYGALIASAAAEEVRLDLLEEYLTDSDEKE